MIDTPWHQKAACFADKYGNPCKNKNRTKSARGFGRNSIWHRLRCCRLFESVCVIPRLSGTMQCGGHISTVISTRPRLFQPEIAPGYRGPLNHFSTPLRGGFSSSLIICSRNTLGIYSDCLKLSWDSHSNTQQRENRDFTNVLRLSQTNKKKNIMNTNIEEEKKKHRCQTMGFSNRKW